MIPGTEWDSADGKLDASTWKSVEERLAPLAAGQVDSVRVSFIGSPRKFLAAPVTEVIFATAKPEIDLEAFANTCDVALQATNESQGSYGSTRGYTSKSERDIVMVLGWESIEVGILPRPMNIFS